MLGALLEVEMFKKCTPLWREAHFGSKMVKDGQGTSWSEHFWIQRQRQRPLLNEA